MEPTPAFKVLLVGHCGPDAWMLKSFAQRTLPSATVAMVNDEETLAAQCDARTVLLVNRVLDGEFAGDSGVELIRRFAGKACSCMLISNYAEAQREAIDAGGRPGFGKSQLAHPDVAQRLRDALKPGAKP